MKLSSLDNKSSIYKPNYNNNNVNFSGTNPIVDGMVKFWQMVDKGGRAAQFTCEDMFGTNLPRMRQGLIAGKKYTGKYNWKAFIQESIREILTGPTMTFFPMIALICCKKMLGPSANTKVENINSLSDLMTGVQQGDKASVTNDFFTKVIDDVLLQTLGEDKDKNLTENRTNLTKALKKYSEAFNSLQSAKMPERKQAKTVAKEHADSLVDLLAKIIKNDKSNFDDTNFQTLKYTLTDANGETKTASMNAKSYFEFVVSYIHDFTKKNANADGLIDTSKSAIRDFKSLHTAKRIFTLANMILLTGLLMRQIPKLYTRGRVNPNAEEVYNEAKKRDGAITKGATK